MLGLAPYFTPSIVPTILKLFVNRIPKYSLPNVDQLVTNVNKKILSSYKEKIKKEKPVVDKKDEELANTDPTIGTVKTQTQQCIELTEYKTLEFVEVTPTKVTVQEILPIIKIK